MILGSVKSYNLIYPIQFLGNMFCTFLSFLTSVCYLHKTKGGEVSHRYQVKTTKPLHEDNELCTDLFYLHLYGLSSNIQHNSARKDLTVGCCALCGAGLDTNCIPGEAMSPTPRGCNLWCLTQHFSIPFQTENTGRNTIIYSNYNNHWDAFQEPTVFSQFLLCSSQGISEINSLSLLTAEQFLSGRVSSSVFLLFNSSSKLKHFQHPPAWSQLISGILHGYFIT